MTCILLQIPVKELEDVTLYIIIGSSVGGFLIITVVITIGVIMCCRITVCCFNKNKQKPRQVKYILKPPTAEQLTNSREKSVDVSCNSVC